MSKTDLEKMTEDRDRWERTAEEWQNLYATAQDEREYFRDLLQTMIENDDANRAGSIGKTTYLETQRDDWRRKYKQMEEELL